MRDHPIGVYVRETLPSAMRHSHSLPSDFMVSWREPEGRSIVAAFRWLWHELGRERRWYAKPQGIFEEEERND